MQLYNNQMKYTLITNSLQLQDQFYATPHSPVIELSFFSVCFQLYSCPSQTAFSVWPEVFLCVYRFSGFISSPYILSVSSFNEGAKHRLCVSAISIPVINGLLLFPTTFTIDHLHISYVHIARMASVHLDQGL